MHAGFHVTLSFSKVTISDGMRVKIAIAADTVLTCVAKENYPVATSDYTFVFFHGLCFLKKENKFSPCSVKLKTPVRQIRRLKKCCEKMAYTRVPA